MLSATASCAYVCSTTARVGAAPSRGSCVRRTRRSRSPRSLPRRRTWHHECASRNGILRPDEPWPDHEVAIVGAGFSGIGAAIKLDEAGIDDSVILEAGDGVGGAWHWNTYPGVCVDIPSPSYQFSFEQRDDWSKTYAPGDELKDYAEDLVDRYGLRSRIRLGKRGQRGPVRRGRRRLGARHGRRRADHRPLRGRRHRRVLAAQAARRRGARQLRGHRDAHRRAGTTSTTCAAAGLR